MLDPDEEYQMRVVESLTEIMSDREQKARDRLRAAELLAYVLGMLSDEPEF